MDRNSFTRSIVEGLVDQYVEEIRRDPKRSIRKLVDLGGQFAKGRFQKQIIGLMQSVLSNEKSPYYTFAQEIAEDTDLDRLKTFGINVGLNSWTVGAKMIREKESELGYNIPWSLTFHINDVFFAFPPEEIQRLVKEGKACGIYTYLLHFTDENLQTFSLSDYHAVAGENPDCAFVYFLPPGYVRGQNQNISEISSLSNVMVSVDDSCAGWEDVLQIWKENRCLRAVHRFCSTREEKEDIVSGTWLGRAISAGASFAFCFAAPSYPLAERKELESYLAKIRAEQKYPIFPMDYYADHLLIDQIISDGPCYLGILPDGTVTRYDGCLEQRTKQNIFEKPLLEILKGHPVLE